MPRIPEQDLQRLKEEVSVQRLVEASGVALKKAGKDQLGQCPFHDDREASLVVSGGKNLWHCFGCQIGGGPIDWVMKTRAISFRHAVEVLQAGLDGHSSLAAGGPAAGPVTPVKRSSVRSLPPPVALDADDQALMAQTLGYYHQRIRKSPQALAYLASRGLDHPGLIDAFKLGVADRSLGLRLPEKRTGKTAPPSGSACKRSASCARAATSTSTALWWCRCSTRPAASARSTAGSCWTTCAPAPRSTSTCRGRTAACSIWPVWWPPVRAPKASAR